MSDRPVYAVLGAGNSGFGLAADLAYRGFETRLYELPEFASALEPVAKSGGIKMRGTRGDGFAKLALATTEIRAAIEGADVLFVVVPAYGHRRVAELLAPHVTEEDCIVILPGNAGGALEFRDVIRKAGNDRAVKIAEGSGFIFACKKDGPDGVWIRGTKQDMPVAALPARDIGEVLRRTKPAYPEFAAAQNVLDTSLNNINHPVHPSAFLLNLGKIEYHGNDWSFFHEGMTPSVCRFMGKLDEERVDVAGALGLPRITLLEWSIMFYGNQGFGGKDLYEAFSTTPVHGAARPPASVDHRYFNEDIPYGLVPIASLGRALGLPMRVTVGAVDVCSAVAGRDFWAEGRTLEKLGLAGLDRDGILSYVEEGK
jgi:opine dehydrogenase